MLRRLGRADEARAGTGARSSWSTTTPSGGCSSGVAPRSDGLAGFQPWREAGTRSAGGAGTGRHRAAGRILLDVVEAQKPVIVAALPAGRRRRVRRRGGPWVNGNQYVLRQRFTLAHEFGHAWIGHDGRLEPDTVETLSGRTNKSLRGPGERVRGGVPGAEGWDARASGRRADAGSRSRTRRAITAMSAPAMVIRLEQCKAGSPSNRAAAAGGRRGPPWLPAHRNRSTTVWSESTKLPYLSPSLRGSLLEAALRGDAAVDRDVAAAIQRLMA